MLLGRVQETENVTTVIVVNTGTVKTETGTEIKGTEIGAAGKIGAMMIELIGAVGMMTEGILNVIDLMTGRRKKGAGITIGDVTGSRLGTRREVGVVTVREIWKVFENGKRTEHEKEIGDRRQEEILGIMTGIGDSGTGLGKIIVKKNVQERFTWKLKHQEAHLGQRETGLVQSQGHLHPTDQGLKLHLQLQSTGITALRVIILIVYCSFLFYFYTQNPFAEMLIIKTMDEHTHMSFTFVIRGC